MDPSLSCNLAKGQKEIITPLTLAKEMDMGVRVKDLHNLLSKASKDQGNIKEAN